MSIHKDITNRNIKNIFKYDEYIDNEFINKYINKYVNFNSYNKCIWFDNNILPILTKYFINIK